MSERRWFRSLYWRIALGFIALLALLLVAQATSFVWLAVQTEGGQPERVGQDFAELVAAELSAALASDPALDLRQYASRRLGEFHRPAFVIFPGGAVVGPPGVEVPPGLERLPDIRTRGPRLSGRGFRGPGRLDGQGPPPGAGSGSVGRSAPGAPPPGAPTTDSDPDGPGRAGPQTGPPRPGRRPPPLADRLFGPPPEGGPRFPRRRPALAPVFSGERVVATVFVTPIVDAERVTRELGPWIALGAALLLVGGTAVAALLVFRPAHRQLRELEAAARRLGEGDLTARAPASGGDEVAAVAHAFNQMADDLTARQAQLARSDRTRRQLLADVSHELMTPLTAIRGYAETLALPQFEPSAPDGQRYVRIIQEEVDRIERLVGDLLDLARYEAAGVSLSTEDVPVSELFDRVVARHEQAARDKQVTIEVRLPDEEMTVVADPGRLEQALQNLASNALRHTPAGGRITVSAQQRDDRTLLRVADTGTGMDAEHLPYVFDRFYKADPARAETGSGLGLSIVKAIVERHGGRVTVRSTPDVETEFTIDLPRR